VIFRYYVDVSGKETTRGNRVITAAGYLGSEAQWQLFERHWRATLRLANLPYFHATDFFAGAGPFSHLGKGSANHKQIAALLALIAYTDLPRGFSSSLDLKHFRPLFTAACQRLRTPHSRIPSAMIAVAEVCSQAAKSALPPGGTRAEMFLEDSDDAGEIVEWLRHLKRIGEPWTGAFVGFGRLPGTELPFQAADYLAHETWHEAAALLANPDRGWKDITRDQFKLLATGPLMERPELGFARVEVRYATEEHFRRSAPLLAAFIAAHPEYQKSHWAAGWRRRSRRWARARWRDARWWARGKAKRLWFGRLGMRWPGTRGLKSNRG